MRQFVRHRTCTSLNSTVQFLIGLMLTLANIILVPLAWSHTFLPPPTVPKGRTSNAHYPGEPLRPTVLKSGSQSSLLDCYCRTKNQLFCDEGRKEGRKAQWEVVERKLEGHDERGCFSL
jgi:hypothetical protein